ncbi:hypothetical protein BGX24_011480 [Mortierella sp. AD032]|nr:hypothetical protein BGX24_011480 [Mortierella sp. AD032]
MPMGIDPSFEAGSGPARTVKKRKSQTSLHGGHTSRSSGTPPPLPSSAGAIHPSTSSSYVSTSPTGFYESEQAAYFEQGGDSTPPSKKPARRKESSGNDYPYTSSSPHHRTGQRSSHDGHDSGHSAGSGVAARRKTSEPSYVVSGRHSRDGSEEMAHGGEYNYHPHPHSHHNNGNYSNGMAMNYTAGQNIEGGEAMMSKHHNSNINHHPYSDDQDDPSRALSPQQNNSLNQMQPRGPGKKQPHELLTDAEKKANHIASEQKRRQNIRIGFDSLVEIVPTLSECQRSEALILQKSVDYIQRLLDQKNELKSRVRDLQVNLGENADGDESASEMEFEE